MLVSTKSYLLFWSTIWMLFCVVALIGGEMLKMYERFWWFDLALHGASGAFLTAMLLCWEKDVSLRTLLTVSGYVVNMLVLWEVFEFAVDTYFNLNMQKDGIKDTMEDLIVGKIGVLYMSIVYYMKWRI